MDLLLFFSLFFEPSVERFPLGVVVGRAGMKICIVYRQ